MKLRIALLIMIVLIGTISCKKKSMNPVNTITKTAKVKLIGTWKQTAKGEDKNGNNIADDSEKDALLPNELLITYFYADGTALTTARAYSQTDTLRYRWELRDNDTKIHLSELSGLKGQTSDIALLTETDLHIWTDRVDPSMPRGWSLLVKQ